MVGSALCARSSAAQHDDHIGRLSAILASIGHNQDYQHTRRDHARNNQQRQESKHPAPSQLSPESSHNYLTLITRPEVIASRSAGESLNTARGVPAAAQMS